MIGHYNRKKPLRMTPEERGGSEHFISVFVERFEHNRHKRFPDKEAALAFAEETRQSLTAAGETFHIRVVDNVSGLTLFTCGNDSPGKPAAGEGNVFVVHIEPVDDVPASSALFEETAAVAVAEEAAALLDQADKPYVIRITLGRFGRELHRWEKG